MSYAEPGHIPTGGGRAVDDDGVRIARALLRAGGTQTCRTPRCGRRYTEPAHRAVSTGMQFPLCAAASPAKRCKWSASNDFSTPMPPVCRWPAARPRRPARASTSTTKIGAVRPAGGKRGWDSGTSVTRSSSAGCRRPDGNRTPWMMSKAGSRGGSASSALLARAESRQNGRKVFRTVLGLLST